MIFYFLEISLFFSSWMMLIHDSAFCLNTGCCFMEVLSNLFVFSRRQPNLVVKSDFSGGGLGGLNHGHVDLKSYLNCFFSFLYNQMHECLTHIIIKILNKIVGTNHLDDL